MCRGRLTTIYIQIWQKDFGFKTYKEVKPHYSEESEDKVVERERENYKKYEYVYYFLVDRAPARSRV